MSITVTVTLPATEPRAPTPTSGAHSISSSSLAWAQANNTTACQTLFSYFTYQSSSPLSTCFLLYQTLSQFKPRQNLTHLLTFHVQKHKIDNICLNIYATIIYLNSPAYLILNACSWVFGDHNDMLCQSPIALPIIRLFRYFRKFIGFESLVKMPHLCFIHSLRFISKLGIVLGPEKN